MVAMLSEVGEGEAGGVAAEVVVVVETTEAMRIIIAADEPE